MEPETRYARLGEDRIAYQVVGEGPVDLVISRGTFSTLDAIWAMPETSAPYASLAGVCRLIMFDRLGTGWSDAVRRSIVCVRYLPSVIGSIQFNKTTEITQ